MNDSEIQQFQLLFQQFMNNSETSIFKYYERTNPSIKQIKMQEIPNYEERAAALEVTVDYYIQEFT